MISRRFLIAVPFLALACSEAEQAASLLEPPGISAAVRPVPFRIRLTVTGNPPMPPFPAGCEVYFTTSVAGNATHLGKLTGVGATCAFNAGVTANPPFLPDGPPPYFVAEFTNDMTWIAANGDELWFSVTDPPAVFVQSLTNGAERAQGQGMLVGGTGRFEGATGEIQVVAVGNVMAVSDDFVGDGWIMYDASNGAN